jgi:L-fucose isomerase-like protein
VLRSLGTRERLARSSMLAYLDDLGAGMQPDIFKRFYWWEDACVADLEATFGVRVERRSFKALAARAAAVGEERVVATARRIAPDVPVEGLSGTGRAEALRLYLALADELDETGDVLAAGINCLNESTTSPTTPCLAWNLLYEERGTIWGCEADLTSMITEAIVHQSLDVPVMMTNIYPFLMGHAALDHEKIPYFPDVTQPQNHILVAHCGFFGVVPRSFATEWVLRPRVLEIVDPEANAIDARFPTGPVTIVKISSDMRTLSVTPAELTGYQQYPGSDCLNGAILRVADGYDFVESTPSHHVVLVVGDVARRLQLAAEVWGFEVRKAPAVPPLPAGAGRVPAASGVDLA